MDDELSFETKALHAKQVLENPAFKRAFDRLRNAYFDAIDSAQVGDNETVLTMHHNLQALKRVKLALEEVLIDAEEDRLNREWQESLKKKH